MSNSTEIATLLGRDASTSRGLSARDIDAFIEAWSRSRRRDRLDTYLGDGRADGDPPGHAGERAVRA